LQPDCVVQSPLRTTPKDPSPNFPNKHKSFSLIRQVRLGFTLFLSNDFTNAAVVGCSVVLRFSLEEDDPADIYAHTVSMRQSSSINDHQQRSSICLKYIQKHE